VLESYTGGLQARSKIWRLAYDGLLLGSARADQIADNHQTCRNADTSV
jgi:hypothetical protein